MTHTNSSGERHRIGVRLTLVLLVLVPMASVAGLIAMDTTQQWRSWHQATGVAQDANQLERVAVAEDDYFHASALAYLIAYGSGIGLSATKLDTLMGFDLQARFRTVVASIRTDGALEATPALRRDTDAIRTTLEGIGDHTVPLASAQTDFVWFTTVIVDLWNTNFSHLQRGIEAWRPTGSFGDQVATLQQVFTAFMDLSAELEDLSFVGVGLGDAVTPLGHIPGTPADPEKDQLFMAMGAYAEAVDGFQNQLDPRDEAVWQRYERSPQAAGIEGYLQEGIRAIQQGGPAPLVTDPDQIGPAADDAAAVESDVSEVVVAVAHTVGTAATGQASTARGHFAEELGFLLLVGSISLAGVVVTSNALTRPLKRLGVAAERIRVGEFALDPLRRTGPRELALTTDAFNEMTATLKGLEQRTLALSAEDFTDPALTTPMPGPIGQALQTAVDLLTARIHERDAQRRALHDEATHDRMTGLLNRSATFDYLATDVTRRRNAGETVAVLFADLDGLKSFNDTFGHAAGDAAIVQTAEAACRVAGPCDVVGRLGGDEFLVVLCHDHSGAAHDIAEALRAEVSRRTVRSGDTELPLTCSVGVAIAECDARTDPMELVKRADDAMYEAKKAARSNRDRLLAGEP